MTNWRRAPFSRQHAYDSVRTVLILAPLPCPPIVRAVTMSTRPPKARFTQPSLSNLTGSGLDPKVISALREVSLRLTSAGVRHAVVGALAVGVYGWPRATRDVDLLVGREAWDRLPGGELIPRVELPESIEGVGIDVLSTDVAGDFLEAALDAPLMSDGIPIAPPEVVICTKLLRLVMRDQADIVEMVKAGLIDRDRVRGYLMEHAPMLVSRWDALALQADRER